MSSIFQDFVLSYFSKIPSIIIFRIVVSLLPKSNNLITWALTGLNRMVVECT